MFSLGCRLPPSPCAPRRRPPRSRRPTTRGLPRSRERGPIEASSATPIRPDRTSFRVLANAAPLKLILALDSSDQSRPFRVLANAAPLKPHSAARCVLERARLPRSRERGPIEAAVPAIPSSPEGSFRVLANAAPLKPSPEQRSPQRLAPFRVLANAAPLKHQPIRIDQLAGAAFRVLANAAPLKPITRKQGGRWDSPSAFSRTRPH